MSCGIVVCLEVVMGIVVCLEVVMGIVVCLEVVMWSRCLSRGCHAE